LRDEGGVEVYRRLSYAPRKASTAAAATAAAAPGARSDGSARPRVQDVPLAGVSSGTGPKRGSAVSGSKYCFGFCSQTGPGMGALSRSSGWMTSIAKAGPLSRPTGRCARQQALLAVAKCTRRSDGRARTRVEALLSLVVGRSWMVTMTEVVSVRGEMMSTGEVSIFLGAGDVFAKRNLGHVRGALIKQAGPRSRWRH
jgi:hypothetical protein